MSAQPAKSPITFEQAWAAYEAQGYKYGEDELEAVRFGWQIAQESLAAPREITEEDVKYATELYLRGARYCESQFKSIRRVLKAYELRRSGTSDKLPRIY